MQHHGLEMWQRVGSEANLVSDEQNAGPIDLADLIALLLSTLQGVVVILSR